jgi:signal transduction histidine kinase
MRRRVTVVFAAWVAAFFASNIFLALSLWPQLEYAEALSTQYAASSTLIARMTGDVQAIRSSAAAARLQSRDGAIAPSEADREELERARRDLGVAVGRYALTPMTAEEVQAWAAFRGEVLPQFERAVDGAIAPAPPGADVDQQALDGLRAVTTDATARLQELAELNAQGLDATGQEIHAAVAKLVLVCVALGVAGTLGGLVLVRWALAAVKEYERTTSERLAELDDFAGRVAHDLRNPIQAMGMSLALVQRRATDEATRATVEKAQGAARRMAAFVDELLRFARSGATPVPGATARVDEVLRAVEQELAPAAAAKEVAVIVRAPPDAPRAAITPEALRAIVGNLADNAVKHVPPGGGGAGRVELVADGDGKEVRIAVRDTGDGIAPEALPRLFEPFFRGTTRPGGFGIGLKTVKRLVDAHGGRISVQSQPGSGSVFTVTLPAAPGPGAAAPGAAVAS